MRLTRRHWLEIALALLAVAVVWASVAAWWQQAGPSDRYALPPKPDFTAIQPTSVQLPESPVATASLATRREGPGLDDDGLPIAWVLAGQTFADRAAAEADAAGWRGEGYPVFVQALPGHYRVLLGPKLDQRDALALQQAIAESKQQTLTLEQYRP